MFSDYNDVKAVRYMNSELADTYGNLLNRCTGQILNSQQKFPAFCLDDFNKYYKDSTAELQHRISTLPGN